MRRRDFIKLIACSLVGWPFPALAQQQTMRLVGVLNGIAADGKEAPPRVAAFREALRKLGWIEGSNIRIEHRWVVNDPEKYRSAALELVALKPDVLVGHSTPATNALRAGKRHQPTTSSWSFFPTFSRRRRGKVQDSPLKLA
jgi:putative ABC transport system substrate-binding protein